MVTRAAPESMHVLAHSPHAWFLLEDELGLLLDVNCSHSAASFDMLVRLSAAEAAGWRDDGQHYLDGLAAEIQHHALSLFHERNLDNEFRSKATAAILQWLSNAPTPE